MNIKKPTDRTQGFLYLMGAAILAIGMIIVSMTSLSPTEALATPEGSSAPVAASTPPEAPQAAPTEGPLTDLVVQPVLKRIPMMTELDIAEDGGPLYGTTSFNVMDFELPTGCSVTDEGKTYSTLIAFQIFPEIPVADPVSYVRDSSLVLTNVRMVVDNFDYWNMPSVLGAHFVADARLVPKDGKAYRESDVPLYMDAKDIYVAWGSGRGNDPLVSCSII
ncbi:hypothetical protein [Arthrobacter sp. lap29]|uniref:hypothetical protein n=1 Tax=Arthrobacter sp. lap29 TaxID=3056122 RepID=UPI0028F7371C|nr:hypothetical protein [Arthrobacter sp. lap29]